MDPLNNVIRSSTVFVCFSLVLQVTILLFIHLTLYKFVMLRHHSVCMCACVGGI